MTKQKKSPEADLNNHRPIFSEIGMAAALLFVLGAFSYTQYDAELADLGEVVYDEEIVIVENTVQEKKPPPPPPPPELDIVEDEEEIEEEQPEFEETEMEEDEEIAPMAEEEEELEETNEVLEFFEVSKNAEYKDGGLTGFRKYVAENLEYPQMAVDAEVEGTVLLVFVVDKNGNITDVQVGSKKLGYGLEEEAIRIIKKSSGDWSPAEQRDKKVAVRFRFPVQFRLY
jgi:protein TonB